MKEWAEYHVERIKNYYLTQGDFDGAFFLHALHIKILELNKRRNKNVLCQEYDILNDLADTIFLGNNGDLAKLTLEMAGLILINSLSEQEQESHTKMAKLFSKVWKGQPEILLFFLVRNALTIKAELDEEILSKYMDNILAFIKDIYGYESRVHARIYLHFLCECRYDSSALYKEEFIKKYEYFKKHLEGYDCFYVSCLFSCMPIFMKQDKKEYEYWLREFKNAVAANKSTKEYPDLVCQLAYVRAIEYEKDNDSQAVVRILNKVIDFYILPESVQNNLLHVYILSKAAAHHYELNEYKTMIQYVRKGIDICEELGKEETDLYYEIYNYVGVKMIYDGKYMDAQEFYSKNCMQIEKKLGKTAKIILNPR